MGGIGAKRGDVVVTDAGVVPPAVDEHHDVVAAGRLPQQRTVPSRKRTIR